MCEAVKPNLLQDQDAAFPPSRFRDFPARVAAELRGERVALEVQDVMLAEVFPQLAPSPVRVSKMLGLDASFAWILGRELRRVTDFLNARVLASIWMPGSSRRLEFPLVTGVK